MFFDLSGPEPPGFGSDPRDGQIMLGGFTGRELRLLYGGWGDPHAKLDETPLNPDRLASLEPADRLFGVNRGLPLDRLPMGWWMSRHATAIRGAVIELELPIYADFWGGNRVSHTDILDIEIAGNEQATLTADLSIPGSLDHVRGTYDCFIATQVLQAIPPDLIPVALQNILTTLRPGGSALVTISSIAPIDPGSPDLCRLTPDGLKNVIGRALPEARSETLGWGNKIAAQAFLDGLSFQDCIRKHIRLGVPEHEAGRTALDELNVIQPWCPVLAMARIQKVGQ